MATSATANQALVDKIDVSETAVRKFQGHRFTRLMPWVALLMLTGCRVHEAASLRWIDVDLEHGSVIFRSTKTGRERRMLLDDPLDRVSPGMLAF